jgi:soluble lytic murein transglycosylase-like protein
MRNFSARSSYVCFHVCLASAAIVCVASAAPASAHVIHHYRHARAAAAQQTCTGWFGIQIACPTGSFASAGALAQPAQPRVPTVARSAPAVSYAGFSSAQAGASGVPQSLIDRVIKRESGGNPRAVSHGNYGLMQIRLSTARAMGYTGSAAGLLDPQTNMTYAVRYLAGAYRAAGGNEARAIALYSSGY